MTFDEAIFCMKQYLPDSDSLECMKCPYYHTVPIEGTENGFTCKADEAHKMALKALEQGDVLREIRQEIEKFQPKKTVGKLISADVLDKIRAEIKALSNANPSYWHSGDMVEREEVFEIIDKYKAESESDKE